MDDLDSRATKFFQSDFFHNVHLGVLKSFCSSAIVSLVEANPPLPCFKALGSVEKKFDRLSTIYQQYFRDRGKKPWVSELSRDLVCWPMSSTCPAAKWNKGMASTEILRFIDWFACQFLPNCDYPIIQSVVLWLTWFGTRFLVSSCSMQLTYPSDKLFFPPTCGFLRLPAQRQRMLQ